MEITHRSCEVVRALEGLEAPRKYKRADEEQTRKEEHLRERVRRLRAVGPDESAHAIVVQLFARALRVAKPFDEQPERLATRQMWPATAGMYASQASRVI